jgi:hypothetical protein
VLRLLALRTDLIDEGVALHIADLLLLLTKHAAFCLLPLLQVLGRGTDLVDEGVGLRMAGLLHSMGPSCPGLVDASFAQLKDKQKASFTAFMAGQVPK